MRTFPRVLLTCLALTALAAPGCSDSEERQPAKDASGDEPEGDAGIGECDSTWKAIQKTIIEGKRCAQGECHGANKPGGGLDLRPSVAYDNLIYKDSQASLTSPLYRVYPGEQALSFLYLKLAAGADETATLPPGGGSPMPVGTSPVSAEELAAVRLWIRAGAPETGVVEGTQSLLDCDLSDSADPNKTIRPPVPAGDEGFQHVAGPWTVGADSENEVCFATYYDLSDTAPDWAQFPCELQGDEHTCVGFKRRQLSQDAQSHHSIISVYTGSADAHDPSWGAWQCAGGALAGTPCDPMRLGVSAEEGGADCGEDGVCQGEVVKKVACRGYGPKDKDMKQISAGGAQSPVSTQTLPDGVFGEIPIKGVIIWNSHGFNLTDKDTTVEQFNTYWYAPPEERVHLVRRIFDQRYIFTMRVPAFQSREICASFTLPQYARLSELGSHVHQRGVRWRTWLPPQQPDCTPDKGCAPNEEDPFYESFVYNDPLSLPLEPALQLDSADPADRTLKYCAVYDNGEEHPELVKRASQLPEGSRACAANELYCLGGERQGETCSSDDDCEGGVCDACMVTGGVTTEDEMFILLGFYYVVPPEE